MAKHGRKASVKIKNLAGVLTDISRKTNSCDVQMDVENLDTTQFQATSKEYTLGYKDTKTPIAGFADDTIALLLLAILGEENSTGGVDGEGFDIEIGPEGTAVGKRKYTGKVKLTKYTESMKTNAANSYTGELQWVTDLTVGTFA
jgi:hypothetical protein